MDYLIIVDVQNDFVTGSLGSDLAVSAAKKIVPKIVEFSSQNHEIILTMDTHYDDYLQTSEGKMLPVKHCIHNTNGWELYHELSAVLSGQEKVYEKNTFGSVDLAVELSAKLMSDDSVTFVGLCTDICVVSNCLMLKAYSPETRIIVDSQCCAGVTPQLHENALSTMKSCQIEVI